jgi:D-alanyl-D-alanine endopeptidase (penicillin-binding protein 7)
MRMTLRAALLLGAMVGTVTLPIEEAHALEKGKGKTESQKSKALPVIQKGKGKAAAQKDKVESVARTNSSRSSRSKGKVEPIAGKDKALSPTRHGMAAPLAHKDKSGVRVTAKSARVARIGKYASPEASGGLTHSFQKKNLTRVLAGHVDLWQDPGRLAVQSGSALVIGQDSGEPLYEKNANAVVPIASITKLMTAMVVLDSMPNLQAPITHQRRGCRLSARQPFPPRSGDGDHARDGPAAGVDVFGEPRSQCPRTSLSGWLAGLCRGDEPQGRVAGDGSSLRGSHRSEQQQCIHGTRSGTNGRGAHIAIRLIREFSTTPGVRAEVKGRELDFHNTNQLVSSPTWEIGLSKTGYIQEAGKCLVMQARVADKPVVIVLLDSAGKQTRIGDANRIKRWMESASAAGRAADARLRRRFCK